MPYCCSCSQDEGATCFVPALASSASIALRRWFTAPSVATTLESDFGPKPLNPPLTLAPKPLSP